MGMRVALPIFAVVLAGVMAVVAVDTAPSAASAPSPPVGIPQDWVAPWREGDLLFGTAEPQETFRQAYMGNGYMATVVGSTDIYVSGVFNGNFSKSVRARVPSTNAITITNSLHTGSALDIRKGTFYRRSYFKPCVFCAEVDIEQRWYAHRFYASLLVHEIEVKTTESAWGESLTLNLANNSGYTFIKETPAQVPTYVVVAYNSVPGSITVEATGKSETFYFITSIRTNHDSADPVADAVNDLNDALMMKSTLLKNHTGEWEKIWEAGIEVGGRFELGQAVNSSLYYLLSSLRAGDYETNSSRFLSSFPVKSYHVSPGSLATTGYNGHSFWDGETWMYPTLAIFYPEVARNLLQYRFNRLSEAKANAVLNGFKGLKFPWESAYTGTEVCGWPPGLWEHHLMGDIALAVQQYWRLTQDKVWMKEEGLPLAVGIAEFWLSHVKFNSTTQRYSINNVIGPDEFAGSGRGEHGVNDNAYTNSIARISIEFAVEVQKFFGLPVDPRWLNVSSMIMVPFNSSGNLHPEYVGYKYGQVVKQADTILMGYPALVSMPEAVRRNDLYYYASVTDINGPAMSWGMFAIGWLELGEYALASKYFNQSYQRNLNLPFNAWQETINGGCPHFITGAGGFLQGLWAGWGGVRIRNNVVEFRPVLPEQTTYIKYRQARLSLLLQEENGMPLGLDVPSHRNPNQFHFLGSQLDVEFNDKSIIFQVTSQGPRPLIVVYGKGGSMKQPLQLNVAASLPLNEGPFHLTF